MRHCGLSYQLLALGRGHNPTESVVAMLDGTGYESHLNIEKLNRIKQHIANVRPRYGEFFNHPTVLRRRFSNTRYRRRSS